VPESPDHQLPEPLTHRTTTYHQGHGHRIDTLALHHLPPSHFTTEPPAH
jgi:hypothetical protein